MEKQVDMDNKTDLATFLYELGNQLYKEGNSLENLAKTWYSKGEEFEILRQHGIDIGKMAKQLLVIKQQLCTNCKMKQVQPVLVFEDPPQKEKQAPKVKPST